MSTSTLPCVVLLSGGLDSATTLASAIHQGFEPHCLTILYGQRHAIEIDCAKAIAAAFMVTNHKIIHLDLASFGGSSLTTDAPVPKSSLPVTGESIPSTYVPARNTVFLSLALSLADAIGARDIFIGVSSVDFSGYPDCRPDFIASFETMANTGTLASSFGKPFKIHTPIIRLTKAETISLGHRLGVDYSQTWSCYDPSPAKKPCGACESCRLRAKGFEEAGLPDPLLAR